MASLPFKISDSRGHEVSGLLYLEDEFLVFEVQVRKWGLYEEPREKVKVEYGALDQVRFKPGFFKDHVYVVPKRTALLEAIPGSHEGEIDLLVAKRYRDQALQFVSDVLHRKQRQQAG